jgi:serine/threonine-protein kinase
MEAEASQNGPLSRLGRYDVLSPVGSGGMAAIYLARIAGPAGFEKPIALKVIHSHLVEDSEFIQMFFNEAKLASQLQHPNIVQVFEFGEAEGIFYLTMEYLQGRTLGAVGRRMKHVEGGAIDARVACYVIMQACEGLHYAHELRNITGEAMELVHRDISPQNLFVTYSGSVKLMDFGIARGVGLAHTTRPGSLKGKFPYMSPEQVRGRNLDRRSDIFSLGTVLWELLAGARLFKGENDFESLRLVGEAHVPSIADFRPDLPPAFDHVLRRALARSVGDRYKTVLDFHNDIADLNHSLGPALNTHKLAEYMRSWFPKEIDKEQSLMKRLLPVANGASNSSASLPVAAVPAVRVSSQSLPSASYGAAVEPGTGVPLLDETGGVAGEQEQTPAQQTNTQTRNALQELSFSTGFRPIAANRERLAWMAGLAAVVAVFVVVVFLGPGWWEGPPRAEPAGHGPSAAAAAASVPQPTSSPAAPVGPAESAASAAPAVAEAVAAQVQLNLRVMPARAAAEVRIDGHPVDDPSMIVLETGTEPVQVEVTAPHYLPATLSVIPDRHRVMDVTLRRRPRQGGAGVRAAPNRPRRLDVGPSATSANPRPTKTQTKRPGQRDELISNPYAP